MGKYPDFFANNPHISGSQKSKMGWGVGCGVWGVFSVN
jgi:hypothetical protein